jgi:lipase maturation factor
MLGFQTMLLLSGNLSFLNWLTIVPILSCFDDALLRRVLPQRLVARAGRAAAEATRSRGQEIATLGLAGVVALLSIGPVANLLSPAQAMNRSFDPLELVNTYGAFGSVGRVRHEIVLEGTDESEIGPATRWREYELPCKPGDVRRRPCVVSPYQPRLDWQIWFAAMATPAEHPWMLGLVSKLLHGDAAVRGLLASDPFPERPPRWIRARLYRYRFAPPGSDAWWERTLEGEWLPPLSADDPRLRRAVAALRGGP